MRNLSSTANVMSAALSLLENTESGLGREGILRCGHLAWRFEASLGSMWSVNSGVDVDVREPRGRLRLRLPGPLDTPSYLYTTT